MLAQFIQDLIHLEGGEDGLDQHGGLDRAAGNAEFFLGHDEYVVPQARFEVRLHLGQIEVGARAARDQFLGIVEHEQGEIEDAAGGALAVDQHVLFVEMPAARTHDQRRQLVVELIALAALLEIDPPPDGVYDVDLALDLVRPERRVGIFEVGHVGIGAAIQGVDDHFAIDRTGDLDASAKQILGQRSDGPVAVSDGGGFRQEVRPYAGIQAGLNLDALLQEFLAARFEAAAKLGDEIECFESEDLGECRRNRGLDFDAGGQWRAHIVSWFRGGNRCYGKVNTPRPF
ncbi:hypothetical protein GALL_251570 [mine drainage metagenome]|uniref:Uncharacterized protein n=1 Tax=mine drainage metagenome TaxID=410659 RepID=A0A1J5RA68_9ZZZZ